VEVNVPRCWIRGLGASLFLEIREHVETRKSVFTCCLLALGRLKLRRTSSVKLRCPYKTDRGVYRSGTIRSLFAVPPFSRLVTSVF